MTKEILFPNSSALRDRVPLIDLVNSEDYQLVRKLLEAYRIALSDEQFKLYINERNSLGEFAAIVAAQNNNLSMLELLHQYKADFSLKDAQGRTVKGWAQHYKNIKMQGFVNLIEQQSGRITETEVSLKANDFSPH